MHDIGECFERPPSAGGYLLARGRLYGRNALQFSVVRWLA